MAVRAGLVLLRPGDAPAYQRTSQAELRVPVARRPARALHAQDQRGPAGRNDLSVARLSSDARHAGTARVESGQYARVASERARQLTRAVSRGDDTPATRKALEEAEADAAWRDPVELARHLTEDWTSISDALKREMLSRLVQGMEVHTRAKAVTLTMRTRWGTSSIYFTQSQAAQPCELPVGDVRWLNGTEALDLATIDRVTLRAWREGRTAASDPQRPVEPLPLRVHRS